MSSISTRKASPLSSSTSQWKYDVFLSFRGEDTRNSFTDHLYVALKQKGLITFRDEEKLERGKSISPELLKAIEVSRFTIVILSKNYATSTWCLDELVKIIKCMKEMKTTVFPIFYDVDPSNVRKQTGSFAEAFSKHEECFKDFIENVHTWRDALREVANLKGWHLLDRSEAQLIQNIVGELWHRLKLYLDGTAIKEIPLSIGLLKNLKVLSFDGCKGLSSFKSTSCHELLPFYLKPKRPHLVGLSPLLGLCSLTQLNLRDCNLREIPNDIGYLFSLKEIDLRENSFVCLPDSISRLCKLRTMDLENCKSLQSLPKLPLSIVAIGGYGCTSLETIPDLLKPNSICEAELYFSNCSKLTDNQGVIDMFFAVIRKHLQGLSLKDRYCDEGFDSSYHIVIPGSVIPKWFIHQSMGAKVNIKVEISSHLRDEWMGIAVCVVFSCLPHHHISNYCDCEITSRLIVNGKEMNATTGTIRMVGLSDHIWLFYLLPQYYVRREDIKLLKEFEENEFSQIGIKIEKYGPSMEVKKCGFRMVYKKDIEDLNQIVAQSSNTSIIPYEDLGVLHHNFDNSTVLAEGNKAKQTHDNYDGAGPSGEGSSNELSHPQRNERFIEFLAHGDSDCEEYLECSEELGDWQKSIESDLEV